MYKLRKSTTEDIPAIMEIISQAQAILKLKGIDQWQNGYPNAHSIETDIEGGYSYVLPIDGRIAATVMLSPDGEPVYDLIENGAWRHEGRYLVIHRIAVHSDFHGMGLASVLVDLAIELGKSMGLHVLRIDTHEENVAMQGLLKKKGFGFCGIVPATSGGVRQAFDLNF